MDGMSSGLAGFFSQQAVQALGWALLHFVWQGALVALLLAAALLLAKRSSVLRYALCCSAMLAMAALAIGTFYWEWDSSLGKTSAAHQIEAETAARQGSPGAEPQNGNAADFLLPGFAGQPLSPWAKLPSSGWIEAARQIPASLPLLVALWTAGVALMSLRLLGGWVQVHRLQRRAANRLPREIEQRLERLARRFKTPGAVRFLQSAVVRVPAAVGWLRPVVLLPLSSLAGLSPQQLEAIVAHELAHIRRRDYLVNLLQRVVETLLFYHPAVWWVSRQIRLEREHCCDDMAVEACGDRVGYARALAHLEALRPPKPASALSMAADGGSLLHRIQRLLSVSTVASSRIGGPLTALAALMVMSASLLATGMTLSAVLQEPAAPSAPVRLIQASAQQMETKVKPLALKTASQSLKPTQSSRGRLAASQLPAAAAMPYQTLPYETHSFLVRTAPAAQSAGPIEILPWSERQWRASHWGSQLRHLAYENSSFFLRNDDKLMGKWRQEGSTFILEASGEVVFSDDDSSLQSLSAGGYLVIQEIGSGLKRRYEAETVEGRIKERIFQDSQASPGEPAAWMARAFLAVIRRSGIGAQQRVERILAQEGIEGVYEEIGQLYSDSARRIYFKHLIEDGKLDARQMGTTVAKIGQLIDSDGDKTRLLIEVSDSFVEDLQLSRQFLEASRTISSDGDRRRLLASVLKRPGLDDSVALLALDSIGEISSDGDQAALLIESASRFALSQGPAAEKYFEVLQDVSSDGDKSRVLVNLMRQHELSGDSRVLLLESSQSISSDGDLARVLTLYLRQYPLDGQTSRPFFQAAEEIASAGDLSRVLGQVTSQGDVSRPVMLQLLEAARRISADGDLARVMVGLAEHCKTDQELLGAYRRLAQQISSDGDYLRAMRAVGER